MPDHSISPFPHVNNLRVKNQCGRCVAVFKITRLLTFWIAVDGVVRDVSGSYCTGILLTVAFRSKVKF